MSPASAAQKLTVVSEPAGFGKTTLVSAWLAESAGRGNAVGWVSLDPSENEPKLFWAYVIGAVQRMHAGVGARAFALLHTSQAPVIENVLAALINEIDAIDSELTLVLDDYHVIEDARIHAGLTFLLDHLPRCMHVVITSRSEPPVALLRLRA